jgi:hypothetical protein
MPHWLHEPVICSSVRFWQDLEKVWTGCGFGSSDFGLKTEPNRTLKRYLQVLGDLSDVGQPQLKEATAQALLNAIDKASLLLVM